MSLTNHNKNASQEEFENRMRVARGLDTISKDIQEERLKTRLSLWEERMLPSYKNIQIDKEYCNKLLQEKKKGPIRWISLTYKTGYERKRMAYKVAKALIATGYSNKDVEIIDIGLLLNSYLDWEERTDFYKKINNSDIRLLIITEVQIKNSNSIKTNDWEMFWDRILKLLSDNPNLDMIILGADSTIQSSSDKKRLPSAENLLYNTLNSVVKIFNFIDLDKKYETSSKEKSSRKKEVKKRNITKEEKINKAENSLRDLEKMMKTSSKEKK